ncbi:hypothetical protein GCM10010532_060430 [Dactylosporangium siamense]|uniref:Uncharacterized protein n=1 Tax=Dactylosporangium siamense TaxID=685454 RepID=A0A919PWZ1_9ACTN|nr:hypothetical protein Dsi01nite_081940 [Dactylosporangium siamense]
MTTGRPGIVGPVDAATANPSDPAGNADSDSDDDPEDADDEADDDEDDDSGVVMRDPAG